MMRASQFPTSGEIYQELTWTTPKSSYLKGRSIQPWKSLQEIFRPAFLDTTGDFLPFFYSFWMTHVISQNIRIFGGILFQVWYPVKRAILFFFFSSNPAVGRSCAWTRWRKTTTILCMMLSFSRSIQKYYMTIYMYICISFNLTGWKLDEF